MPTAPSPATQATGTPSNPQSLLSGWNRIGSITLAGTSGNIILPTAALIAANGFSIDGGTLIVVRGMYDKNTTAVGTSPSGLLMGRKNGGGDGGWMLLYNKADTPAIAGELTCNPGTSTGNDVTDAYFRYTTPSKSNIYDALGCNEFVWLTTVAIAGLTGGSASNTGVQYKVL